MVISEPSPRRSRRTQDQERRRADAIAAAAELFATKGFHDTQMAEIAAAAELSLASVYSMFKGKEALYEEVIRSAMERMRDFVVARVEAVADPLERVLVLIDALCECFEAHRDLLRIVLPGTHGLPWRIRQNMGPASAATVHAFRRWVAGLCRRAARATGVDPETLAHTIVGAITNNAAHSLEVTPVRPLTDLAPRLRAIFAPLLRDGKSS